MLLVGGIKLKALLVIIWVTGFLAWKLLQELGSPKWEVLRRVGLWFGVIPKFVYSLLLLVSFFLLVLTFKKWNLAEDYTLSHVVGIPVVIYNFCRLGFLFYSVLIALSVGEVIRRITLKFVNEVEFEGGFRNLDRLIVCFFVGSSFYGLLFYVLGLFSWINSFSVVLFCLPSVVAVPYLYSKGSHSLQIALFKRDRKIFLLGWFVSFSVSIFIVAKLLYPGVTDSDVYSHYLQYFQKVLKTGSVLPNDIWYHFYHSKAAGYPILIGIFSNVYALQITSAAYVLAIAAILFSIIGTLKGEFWGLLAAGIFLSTFDGIALKHHVAVAALFAFAVWAFLKHLDFRVKKLGSFFNVSVFLSCFYLGAYQPVPTGVIFLCFFCILILEILLMRRRIHLKYLFFLMASLGLGTAFTLVLNFVLTSLPELTPVHFFYTHFFRKNVFYPAFKSYLGLIYALMTAEHLPLEHGLVISGILTPHWEWSYRLLRLYLFRLYLVFPLFLFLKFFLFHFKKFTLKNFSWTPMSLSLFFLLIFMVVGSLNDSSSVLRMFCFSTFFAVILVVTSCYRLFELRSSFRGVNFNSLVTFLLMLTIPLMALTRDDKEFYKSYINFSVGRESLSEVIGELGKHFGSSVRYEWFERVREKLGAGKKVLLLTSYSGQSYFVPELELIAEPAFVIPNLLYNESNQEMLARLRQNKINYFHLNINDQMFSNVAFSELFSPETLKKDFKI